MNVYIIKYIWFVFVYHTFINTLLIPRDEQSNLLNKCTEENKRITDLQIELHDLNQLVTSKQNKLTTDERNTQLFIKA